MEEMLVYGLLMGLYNRAEILYNKKLDALFIENPDNPDLLELELICGNVEESIIYITNHINFSSINIEVFEKKLVECLKILYSTMNIENFSELSYKLWNRLPCCVSDKEPLSVLCYAGDSLSWSDMTLARKNYERLFSCYD